MNALPVRRSWGFTASQNTEAALIVILVVSVVRVGMHNGFALMFALYAASYLLRFIERWLEKRARSFGKFLSSRLRLALLVGQLAALVTAGALCLWYFVPPIIASLS